MKAELRQKIEALGPDLQPEMMQATQAIFASSFRGIDPDTRIERDLAYGPDERHRLDVFRREGEGGGSEKAPVLVYVHGGGFVMGDKRNPDPAIPFYDNIGDFAARSGMVGVTMNYRLAPLHGWPAGPQDLALLVSWLHANAESFGGDPARIVLMGQSAGAVHVASYLAHAQFHPAGLGGAGIAGALLISCIFDIAAADANPFHKAYFGEDEGAYAVCSTTEGLLATKVPFLATVSEFDVADFQKQAAAFVTAFSERNQCYPAMLWLPGHNHLSPGLEIGSPGSALEPIIADFIAAHTA